MGWNDGVGGPDRLDCRLGRAVARGWVRRHLLCDVPGSTSSRARCLEGGAFGQASHAVRPDAAAPALRSLAARTRRRGDVEALGGPPCRAHETSGRDAGRYNRTGQWKPPGSGLTPCRPNQTSISVSRPPLESQTSPASARSRGRSPGSARDAERVGSLLASGATRRMGTPPRGIPPGGLVGRRATERGVDAERREPLSS